MQKYIKAGMLTVVLVLPALVVLFLRGFAENHFQLPYLIPLTDSLGRVAMNGKDTVFYQVPISDKSKIKVISFWKDNASKQFLEQYSRVEKLVSKEVSVEKITGNEVEKEAIQTYRVAPLKKGNAIIPSTEQLVLLDKKGYIRGLYEATNPEEIDRLTAEVKVLLDIYKKEEK